MQNYRLTTDKFIEHAAKWSPQREIVWAEQGIVQNRIGYAAMRDRSNRLSGALKALGLLTGDRVGTLAWNTQHHLEIYYATMSAGFVCHTLNSRFTVAHLAAIVNEAEDRVLAVASSLLSLLRELLPLCPTVEHVILLDGDVNELPTLEGSKAQLWLHDTLLETLGAPFVWGEFDEETPAGLC
ncbi:MAG TPA: AMP-binding protein, partial [Arenimonas sp.]|nr:AMP-binding protein [Arenimonas sp.]